MEHQPIFILPHNWSRLDFVDDLFYGEPDELCRCEQNSLVTQDDKIIGYCHDCWIAKHYDEYVSTRRERLESARYLAEEVNSLFNVLSPALIQSFNSQMLTFFTNWCDLSSDAPPHIQENAVAKENLILKEIVRLSEQIGNFLFWEHSSDWVIAYHHFHDVFNTSDSSPP